MAKKRLKRAKKRKISFFTGNKEVLSILDKLPHGVKSKFLEAAVLELAKKANSLELLFGIFGLENDQKNDNKQSGQEKATGTSKEAVNQVNSENGSLPSLSLKKKSITIK